jgi:DNA-binding CsgD family transcriptional regulator
MTNNSAETNTKLWHRMWHFLIAQESTVIQRQKLFVLFLFALIMEGGTIHGIRMYGARDYVFLTILLSVYALFVAIPPILYLRRRLKLSAALSLLLYGSQTVLSIQMIYLILGVHPHTIETPYATSSYFLPLFLNVTLGIVAFQKWEPFVLSLLSIFITLFCFFVNPDAISFKEVVPTCYIFLILGVLGFFTNKSTLRVDKENQELKENERRLYDLFKVKKDQIAIYMKLAEEEASEHDAENLFEMFDDKARHNILLNAKKYEYHRDITTKALNHCLPELTPAETEVARLILMDKKLSEIMGILGKSESNVTTTRTNIRRKLKLQKNDDLLMALKERMEKNHN